MNNLYIVVSEKLSAIIPLCDDGSGPSESYAIVEMVVARSHSQAGLIAWGTDPKDYTGVVTERPRMSIRCLKKDVAYPRGTVVTEWPCFQYLFRHPSVLATLNATA